MTSPRFSLRVLCVAWGTLCISSPSECSNAATDGLRLRSPNGEVVVTIDTNDQLNYSVTFHGQPRVENSSLGITVDGHDLGEFARFSAQPKTKEIKERYATRGVHATAVNHCLVTTVPLVAGKPPQPWELEIRIFDDGVAYRYRVEGNGIRHIVGERTEWQLPRDTFIWHQAADNRSYEAEYRSSTVSHLSKGYRFMVPAALEFAGGAGFGLITEANLSDYSDMAIDVVDGNRLRANFHDDPRGWDHQGTIVSPWRVTLLADSLNQLVNSDILKNLCPAPSAELANASWIRPGRSTWHWLTGGSPKLAEQMIWIDGARKLGYEYHLVDDGWRDWNGGGENAWRALAGVVRYAKSQGVNIWAWVHSKYVFSPADRADYFRKAKQAGVVGLKIDFPAPANCTWVRWYEDVLRDAAKAELMVDFHGAVKPTGQERTWPNEMTREAIRGREQGKLPSTHDTALPFVRYVQGPADYTPTLLFPDRLKGSSYPHELAMAVVFTSPYLCMGDDPRRYLDSEARDVLMALPPTWDETIVLPGNEIGRLAGFARRKDDQWFVGVINGPTRRKMSIALEFLGDDDYRIIELADNPHQNDAFARREFPAKRGDSLTAELRADGGYVAWIVPRNNVH